MELAPHDLLLIRHPEDLLSLTEQPPWVPAALAWAPYVVVRRTRAAAGLVAVGIRGQTRSERHAALLPLDAIRERITPEQLTHRQTWKTSPHLSTNKALQALVAVSDMLDELALGWGPVGSVGFELATQVATTTVNSDLDLIVLAPEQLPLATAQNLHAGLTNIPVRVDIQVETPYGAFALNEYVQGAENLVLRTLDGPRLVHNPWEMPASSYIGIHT
jgi:phosphoribosyl-dephospho-CoA transferase